MLTRLWAFVLELLVSFMLISIDNYGNEQGCILNCVLWQFKDMV